MARPWRGPVLLVVAVAALTLAACGGSPDRSARSTAGTTGSTGAAGTSGATGAAPAPTTPKGAKKRRSGGASAPTRTADAGGDTAATPASSPSGTGTQGEKPARKRAAKKDKTKKPQFAPGAFEGQADELYKQSGEVCKYLTLDGLAHEYNVQPKTPEAVARRYAQSYPKNVRDAVYRGCLAGLTG